MVSVIIPTFKRSSHIVQAIYSVLNQDFDKPIEIIVVDDNGENEYRKQTEDTLAYLLSHGLIKYIKHKENKGASVARNTGAEIAKGKYLFFLDDDDIFLRNRIKTQVEFLEVNPSYDGCLSAFKRVDSNENFILSDSNYPKVGSLIEYTIKGNFYNIMLCIKKSSFVKIGGFKKISRFQDKYFMLHCLKNNMKFAEIQDELSIVHEHTGDRISTSNISKSIQSLNTIKEYVLQYKELFTENEWQEFLLNDTNMRGTIYYVNDSYSRRLISIKFWIKCLIVTYKMSFLIRILKTFFPNKKIIKNFFG